MIGFLLVQLPFSVCTVWLFFVMLKSRKTHSDTLLMMVMALLSIGFFCGSNHMAPVPHYEKLVIYQILMQFTTLAVFPMICFYIRSLFDETRERPFSYVLFLPAVLVSTCSIVVTILLGVPRAALLLKSIYTGTIVPDVLNVLESAYVTCAFTAYHISFYFLLSFSLVYVFSRLFAGKFKFIHIVSFLRGQKTSFVANVLCLFFVIFFVLWGLCILFASLFMNTMSVWSSLWSFAVSLVLFLIGYVAAIPPLPGGYVNMERMRHPFSAMKQSPQEFLQGIDSGPVAHGSTSGYDKIMESFKQLMVTDQAYLNPSLTIDEIAHKLGSNRTYVSKLVNIYYGMPFRDYLNKLRIDHSKQLMTDEPDAVIDYIALKSGFQSSTQFIRKFRETEGLTPTVWKSSKR